LIYARSLSYNETPDYEYLRSMFNRILVNNGFENDKKFDWVIEEMLIENPNGPKLSAMTEINSIPKPKK